MNMDKLENLKNVWQNQPETRLNYTKEDIHNMVKKKSTSIVKWILIITTGIFAILFLLNSIYIKTIFFISFKSNYTPLFLFYL